MTFWRRRLVTNKTTIFWTVSSNVNDYKFLTFRLSLQTYSVQCTFAQATATKEKLLNRGNHYLVICKYTLLQVLHIKYFINIFFFKTVKLKPHFNRVFLRSGPSATVSRDCDFCEPNSIPVRSRILVDILGFLQLDERNKRTIRFQPLTPCPI